MAYRDGSGVFPGMLLCIGLGLLATFWACFFLVDVLDAFGFGSRLYDAMYAWNPERSQVWVILFTEGGPVEMAQWLLLVAAAGMAFHIHGRLFSRSAGSTADKRARTFWLLMGIAFLLMLIEDAGNPRHWFRYFFWTFTGDDQGRISEMVYFALLGSLPLSALMFFGRPVLQLKRTRNLLLGGFFFYAVAVGGSMTRYYWYETAGDWLHEKVLGGALKEVSLGSQGLGFWLMDYCVEESLELLGATFLAAMAASFLKDFEAFQQLGKGPE